MKSKLSQHQNILNSKLFSEANKKNQFYRSATNQLYNSGCCKNCKYKSYIMMEIPIDRIYGIFGNYYSEQEVNFCTVGGFKIENYSICNKYSPSREYIKNNVIVKRNFKK